NRYSAGKAAEWLKDWQGRADVKAWMLLEQSIALRGVDRDEEAAKVTAYAVEKTDADSTTPLHAVWRALDQALAGDTEAAAAYFQSNDLGRLDDYHFLVAGFARAVLHTLTIEDRSQAFSEARNHLAQTVLNIKQP